MQEGLDAGHLSGYVDHTVLHPLGLALVLICGLVLFSMPRRYAIWPMLVIACFVAPAQRLYIFGLNFTLLRITVLFVWMRILARGETAALDWKPLDTVMLLWSIVTVGTFTLLAGSGAALVNRLGVTFDAVGMYFAFRCLIRAWDDLEIAVKGIIILSVPVAVFFLVEKATGRNCFALFGGVPALTVVREGKLRCQGAFEHPILAGCFWASVMPLMGALWWKARSERPWVVAGVGASCLIIIACSSSTPVMAVLLSIMAAAFFPIRSHMRQVRWGILVSLAALHMMMNKPVWHLLGRINVVAGSTGWHRYQVIDQAISHISEWWALGTLSVDNWEVWAGDITNQYILEGIMGGVWKLILFLATIALGFGAVGRLVSYSGNDRYHLVLSWSLGVALFAHCMNFFGVCYFGQIMLLWYLQLAALASLAPRGVPVRASQPASPEVRVQGVWEDKECQLTP